MRDWLSRATTVAGAMVVGAGLAGVIGQNLAWLLCMWFERRL